MNGTGEISSNVTRDERRAALAAGLGMLAMTIVAGVANFGAVQPAIASGDTTATAANIATSETAFRLGALGLLVVALLDVVVAWGLYEFFRRVRPGLSLIGAWLRIVYTAIFVVAIIDLFGAARLAGTNPAATLNLIEGFQDGWMVGLVFFGLHLIVVGILAWRSRRAHWIFGLLLVVSGIGYLADSVGALALSAVDVEIALYTFFGEMLFMLWLVVRGIRGNLGGKGDV